MLLHNCSLYRRSMNGPITAARCLVCGEVVTYPRNDRSKLLLHLRANHMMLNMSHLDTSRNRQQESMFPTEQQEWIKCAASKSSNVPETSKKSYKT